MIIRIRPFQPADQKFINSLISRFSAFELPGWRQRKEIDSTNRTALQKAMAQPEPDTAIFIAEDEAANRAGFVHLQIQADYFTGEKTGYISDLAVDSSFEGHGIGQALLEKAEAWARGQGCRLLSLYVFAGNARARQIYEKRGFKPEVVKYVKPLE